MKELSPVYADFIPTREELRSALWTGKTGNAPQREIELSKEEPENPAN